MRHFLSTLMLASNPWGVSIVLSAAILLVATIALTITRAYRKRATYHLARTRDERIRALLGDGLGNAWAITAKTILVATIGPTILLGSPSLATRTWTVLAAVLAVDGVIAWWWFTHSLRVRTAERAVAPDDYTPTPTRPKGHQGPQERRQPTRKTSKKRRKAGRR